MGRDAATRVLSSLLFSYLIASIFISFVLESGMRTDEIKIDAMRWPK
jgi:hypothetical protein